MAYLQHNSLECVCAGMHLSVCVYVCAHLLHSPLTLLLSSVKPREVPLIVHTRIQFQFQLAALLKRSNGDGNQAWGRAERAALLCVCVCVCVCAIVLQLLNIRLLHSIS